MKASTRHKSVQIGADKYRSGQKRLHPLLPALVAMSVAAPASALEIGDLQINSTLGHPLQASINYALNPHEELYDFCISLTRKGVDAAIPTLTKAKITVTNNKILLSGSIPIKEPLLAMRLTVNCPYSVHLIRDYTLMINPMVPVSADAQATTPASLQPIESAHTGTIAERVENANTMAVLFQLGIHFMQGHYVHEPEVVLQEQASVVQTTLEAITGT